MRNSTRNVNSPAHQKRRAQLKKSFKTVKTSVAMIKLLTQMESCFQESELGLECWTIARELSLENQPPEQVLSFGKRALKTLLDKQDYYANFPCIGVSPPTLSTSKLNHGSGLFIACVCQLLGAACLSLNRFGECLGYLNWAVRNFTKLGEAEGENRCAGNCVLHSLESSHCELFNVKVAMGRREEAAVHLKNVVEIKEKMLEEGCLELGQAYKNAYQAYLAVMDAEEALPFCVKASEIYTKHMGRDCVEVALMMRELGVIYNGLGEYEKAIEQNQLSQGVLKKVSPDSPELLKAEFENGNMLIELGRYDEAIQVMKSLVSHTNADESLRALSFGAMARAFCGLKKYSDAKKHMRTAQRLLEKRGMNPIHVALGFGDMSKLYEKMNDFETALSLERKVLAVPGLNQKLLLQSSSRLLSLITLSGKVEEGIPYMEDVVEKVKKSFGPEDYEVGKSYSNLGILYFKSGQMELASKFLANAKVILDASLGPHHWDSLATSHSLAITCAYLGRFQPAIEILETVVEGIKIKGMEPTIPEILNDATKLLEEMKYRVAKSPATTSPQSKDDQGLCATMSKFDISEDGRVLE